MAETSPGRELTRRGAVFARLVLYEPGEEPRAIALGKGDSGIGRAEGNAIRLDDSRVSGLHAELRRERSTGRLEIEDQGSSNGTYVNGSRTVRSVLDSNDVIRVGDTIGIVELGHQSRELASNPNRSLPWMLLDAEVAQATEVEVPVLLVGPTGAGKGYVAEWIARSSGRSRPFVQVNCAALPAELVESELFGHTKGAFTGATSDKPGLFETAHGGTLFLDEIGAISPESQAKLLTCIESGTVRRVGSVAVRDCDVRLLAATSLDVHEAIAAGSFRRDLYYRLSAIEISIMGLARRKIDILPLILKETGWGDVGVLSAEALEGFLLYDWPGNVRELLNLARLLGRGGSGSIDYHRLPENMTEFLRNRSAAENAPKGRSKAPPREVLEEGFAAVSGNVSELARRLGKHRNQVVRWLELYGIGRE